MFRLFLASLSLLALFGCMIGPGAKKLSPVRTGQGIDVVFTTTASPQVPLFKKASAEVLEVQEDGLLLRGHKLPASESILRISYAAISEATFGGPKRLNFGKGRIPSPEQREELRLLSRFPQGVSDDVLRRLLAAYHQDELRTIP